ncbi:MAG: hypothetical protein ACI4M6_02670 [Christensenellaceae bacterium]
MIKLTKKSESFIEQYVLNELGYTGVEDDNIAEIVNYIIDNFEVPLSQAKEAGETVDEELLKTATDVVTEITSDPEW